MLFLLLNKIKFPLIGYSKTVKHRKLSLLWNNRVSYTLNKTCCKKSINNLFGVFHFRLKYIRRHSNSVRFIFMPFKQSFHGLIDLLFSDHSFSPATL